MPVSIPSRNAAAAQDCCRCRKNPGSGETIDYVHGMNGMTKSEQVTLGNVLHPVEDVDAAVRFYATTFGLVTKFVDGDRYAALDAGGTTLALAGCSQDITGGAPAASFKVSDVAAALATLVESGGSVVREPQRGPHEVRAVARDPWGNTFVVYGPQ